MAVEFHHPKDRQHLQLAEAMDAYQTTFRYATGGATCPAVPYIKYIDLEAVEVREHDAEDPDAVTVCVRGFAGTTPAPHLAGSLVELLDTSVHLTELQAAIQELYRVLRSEAGGVDGVYRDAQEPQNFLAVAHEPEDMRVTVREGSAQVNGKPVAPAAPQTTVLMAAPETHPRIDLLVLDEYQGVSVVTGEEGAEPEAPAVPPGRLALWEIYHRVGSTGVYASDDATNSYIGTDRRVYL